MIRIAAFVALTLLVLLCEVPARGKVIEFTYRGSFEYVYPEPDAPIGAPAPGTNWTARLLFDDTALDLCSPAHCDPSLAVYQGIGVDLSVDGSLLHFEPVWINVADNFGQSIRGGYFFDQFDVAAGSSDELYLGLYDPTLAAIHSTALPANIRLADWPNHDIVFSPGGVYATGPIDRITSRIVPKPALREYQFSGGQFEFFNGDRWDITEGNISLQPFDVLVSEEGHQRAVYGVAAFSIVTVDLLGNSHTIAAVPDGLPSPLFQDPYVPDVFLDIGLVNVYPEGSFEMLVYDLSIDGAPVEPLDSIGGPSVSSTWNGTFPLPTDFSVSTLVNLPSRNLLGNVTLSGESVPEPASALLAAFAAIAFFVTLRPRINFPHLSACGFIVASTILIATANRIHAAMYSVTNVAGLIAAIDAANQNAEPDTIALATGTTFTLTGVNNSTHGSTGLPIISAIDQLTIRGNGGIIERNTAFGTPNFRLFDVAPNASLALENLTLQGGKAVGDSTESAGGAVYNQGVLTLAGVTISNNVAEGRGNALLVGSPPQSAAVGGGIYSSGTLSIEGGFIQNNRAIGGVGAPGRISFPGGGASNGSRGAHGLGGGLYVSGGTAILNQVNLTSNAAHGGNGGAGRTVTFHGATYGTDGGGGGNGLGGGLYAAAGTITLYDSIAISNSALRGEGGPANTAAGGRPGAPGFGRGGGLYIQTGAVMRLDELTLAHISSNTSSTSDPNIYGPFDLQANPNPPGDYNGDGTVNSADYVVWRNSLGTIYAHFDYNVWRAHFGQTAGSGAALPSAEPLSAAVPEPSTIVLLMFTAAGWCLRRCGHT